MAIQTIEILNNMGYYVDQKLLQACLMKASQYFHRVDSTIEIQIVINQRVPADAEPYKHPGWLEYTMSIRHNDSFLLIGCIQRTIGAEIEFHS